MYLGYRFMGRNKYIKWGHICDDQNDFFMVGLGFEFGALYLLGRCSTTWDTPQAYFCFSCFLNKVLQFYQGLVSDGHPLTYTCSRDRMTCTWYHAYLFWLNYAFANYFFSWLILLISTSQTAGISALLCLFILAWPK
jgi:hypothetical protein